MKVLVTGQVGLEKGEYLTAAQAIANTKGRKIDVVHVGHKMVEGYQGKIDDKTILNLPKALLDLLRRYAWQQILFDIERSTFKDILIVNSHAVFRWHHGFFPAVDLDLVMELQPSVMVTLIEDVHHIKRRLIERGTDFFELWELLAWREEEIWLTRLLSESLKKLISREVAFFVVPRSQGPELLYRLLTEPKTPKVYMSFPKTGIAPDQQAEVDAFKEEVSKYMVAFDPLALEERSIISTAESLSAEMEEKFADTKVSVRALSAELANAGLRWQPYWDEWSALGLTKFDHDTVALEGRQTMSIVEAIDSQIISRDHLLIDQSNFVLMYIRTDAEGKALISAGSQSEMLYAYSQGKPVYVICPGGRRTLSPWVTQFSEVFETLPSALDYLSKRYPSSAN